jgi:hypothetical protein
VDIINDYVHIGYSILINGEPHGRVVLTKGIRLGDPLSPYLFIICVEALSALLQKVEREKNLTGVPIARGRVRINLFFFFFFR